MEPRAVSKKTSGRGFLIGIGILLLDILLSVAAQLVLKSAMSEIGGFDPSTSITLYFYNFVDLKIFLGLGLYGIATVLWIFCLSKLDLSFAYPIATVQYFLIFLGAWYLFGEIIPTLRILGLCVIVIGVVVISLDKNLK